jgi:hypothetical protein
VAQQINLFNPALRQKRSPLAFGTAVLAWSVALVAVAIWAAWVGYGNRTLESQQAATAVKLEAAREQLKQLGGRMAVRQLDPQLVAEVARLEAQVRDRHAVMNYLKAGELGDTRGFSEHFKAFARQSFEGVWLTGLHIASSGNDMTVEGRALKAEYVPGYLKRLNEESIMQGHPFSELVIAQPKAEAGKEPDEAPAFVEFRIATRSQEQSAAKGAQQ